MRKIFERFPESEKIRTAVEKGKRVSLGVPLSPIVAGLADWIAKTFERPVVVIAPEQTAKKLEQDLKFTAGERAFNFPAWDILPYEHQYPSAEIVAERILSLWKFLNRRDGILITTPESFQWKTIPPDMLKRLSLEIHRGDKISPESIIHILEQGGYHREELVEYLQTYARRGDILDVFSPAHPDPLRIEFFGDEIDEIRFFSTRDQRSISRAKSAQILPATEWFSVSGDIDVLRERLRPDAENFLPPHQIDEILARISLDRYFPGRLWYSPLFDPQPIPPAKILAEVNPVVIAVEPEEIAQKIDDFAIKTAQLYERVLWEDFEPLPPELILPDQDEIKKFINSAQVAVREIPIGEDAIPIAAKRIAIPEEKNAVMDLVEESLSAGQLYLVASSKNQVERINSVLKFSFPGKTVIASTEMLSESLRIETPDGEAITILSGDEILGFSRSMLLPRKYHTGKALLTHQGLEQGEYVVHSDYGIARFLGVKELEVNGHRGEFLELEFDEGEKLFVPMEDFYRVSPYIGPKEAVKLSRLGGTRWSAAKLRARQQIYELAGELMRIYAVRQIKTRPPFDKATEWLEYVQRSFPFEETPDQLRAIEEVFADMDSEHPMDRLLCGDVGFGKTEVALRAAVRAVASGRQVAVLVPTTILALQHYETFSSRLADLPIRVEMLSRFTSPAKVRQIKKELAEGKIDIIIGTHALLSDTVHFRNLGLLIIDEEQWFGVRHKEKLKAFRAEVDVLTMTATPIPRTLYFSISGLRDLSVIETPPKSRRPVFTQIVPWNMNLFARAIYSELERGGQVFFIHNRVETISGVAQALKKAMPDVRFAVAHGQMKERELEKIIYDFRRGKYDVLVCTAIIESGTDMPRVNTIIVDRADKFGLAQLYQLRGRVGRSDVQAYAYFVVPPYGSLTKNAKKRLSALMEFSDLGAGYNLALKDLEIRGAGNLLGKEQSGFVAEIGLDLYSKMLAEAVAELKGQKSPILEPIPFSIDFNAYIPIDYIDNTEERISFYKRLFTTMRPDRIDQIAEELRDRFGRPPEPVESLINLVKARLLASMAGFSSLSIKGKWTSLFFSPDKISLAEINRCLEGFEPPPEFNPDPVPSIRIPRTQSPSRDLQVLLKLLEKIEK